MNRRSAILLGVLALVVVLALLSGGDGDAGSDDALVPVAPTRTARTRAARGGSTDAPPVDYVVALRSADLEDVPAASGPGRDPFRFYQAPPPPAPPPSPPARPRPAPVPVAPQPPPPPAQPPVPRPPPVDLTYLGSFGPQDRPIAVFTDGTEIFNVRQGDVIAGKFRVERIGYESADLAFIGFPQEPPQRLPVGK